MAWIILTWKIQAAKKLENALVVNEKRQQKKYRKKYKADYDDLFSLIFLQNMTGQFLILFDKMWY